MGNFGACRSLALDGMSQDWFVIPNVSSDQQITQYLLNLVYEVGNLLRQRPDSLHIATKSSDTDVVTQMDEAAENALVSGILAQFPNDSIIGEEGTAVQGSSQFQWIIDPLDGTVNYLYNLPAWCISVARVNQTTGDAELGVVHAPALERTYWADSNGAFVSHGEQIEHLRVSSCDILSQALVGTGFGYEQDRRAGQARVLQSVLPSVRDIRRFGSCALDLCLVAQGGLDGFFERGVNPWDHSAGGFIARQSGAMVSGLFGKKESEEMIVVANPTLHQQLVSILESVHANSDSTEV